MSDNDGISWIQANFNPTLDNKIVSIICSAKAKLYAGTYGKGIYWSINDGLNWYQAKAPMNDKYIETILYANNTIYAGTREWSPLPGCGLFFSTDDGINWRQANPPLDDKSVYAICSMETTLYAGTELGIYRSVDNGVNWIQANKPLNDKIVKSLILIDKTLYAGSTRGIYKSIDRGLNWTPLNYHMGELRTNDLQYLAELNLLYAATTNGVYFQTLDIIPPIAYYLKINLGAAYTSKDSVSIIIFAQEADSMIISEDATFSIQTSKWEAYNFTGEYLLSGGDGSKTIYVKFKDVSWNESEIISAQITLDTKKPIFLLHSQPPIATIGYPININQQIDEPNLLSMNLYYRRAGESWSVNRMIPFQGIHAEIDGAFITNRGLDYRIIATDLAGHTDTLRNSNLTFFSIPVNIGIDTLGYSPGFPSGTGLSAYRIVSVPMKLNETSEAKSVLGISEKYGEKGNWRIWHYRGNEQWDEGENLPIQDGKGYFLILRNGGMLTNKVAGTTMETTKGITGEIPGWYLEANVWTIVGNPYNTRIELSQLKLKRQNKLLSESNQDSSFQVWGYDGNWKNENIMLNPWDGLAIYVTEADTIVFADRNDPYARSLPKPTSIDSIKQEKLEDGEWIIQVIAQSQDYKDDVNYFGVRRSAKEELDRFDWYEPPMLPGGISVNFPHPEWDNPVSLAADIRQNSEEGYQWEINLKGNGSNVATLNFQDLEKIPQKYDVILIDEETKLTRDLRIQSQITVRIPQETGSKNFTILAGKQDFINDHTNGLSTTPKHFALHQNYPNPFNSTTVIRYELPVASKVTIKIYDLLGKEVMILVDDQDYEAGYYETVVDLSDFACGIYFYQISIRGEKSFDAVKKMIFVK